ncbi:MAG: hypothetical protein KatS3mg078_0687 [Deltaproteobacteria bacterium]|jgi:putative hemolysin|nr:MAG: hypothetical protein KatS3mg078_0687 [Deltaproteobacteria bacterium]
MYDLSLTYNLILMFIFIVLSGFFSMSEGALFSLGKHQREVLKKEKKGILIENLLKDPHKLIITILLADEIINIAYSSVVASTIRKLMMNASEEIVITLVSIGVASPTLLLFGEIGPKTIGVKYPRFVSALVSHPLNLFHVVVTPFRWVVEVLSVGLTRFLGGKGIEDRTKVGFNPDEVKALVGLGSEEGVVTEIEKKLVGGLFKLEGVAVYRIMTPSVDCVFFPSDMPLYSAVQEVKKMGFSRIPVYKGDRDNIIGVLYVKDILAVVPSEGVTIEGFVRPPYFIPRTKRAFDLLREFQQKRVHIAIVVDEYGRVDGIVTMEDILEEIFGEIEDERRIVREPVIKVEREGIVIPGSMRIEEFNDAFLFTVLRSGGLENLGDEIELSMLPSEREHETVGGFVFGLFGRLPQEGEQVVYGKLLFTVNKVSGKRIAELKVQRAMEKEESHVT